MSNQPIQFPQENSPLRLVSSHLPFDAPEAISLNKARMEMLDSLLKTLSTYVELKSALDVGAGVGYFSRFLKDRGFEVVGVEGREENVQEAQRRHPDIQFLCRNVEDPSLPEIGAFDLVLALGLLYHLENPFAAVRNLARMTKQVLLIESMVIGWDYPSMLLVEEYKVINQGLSYVSFYPSESCLVAMLYYAGMPFIYKPKKMPNHKDFKRYWLHDKARTILVATPFEVSHPALVPIRFNGMPSPLNLDDTKFRLFNRFYRAFSKFYGFLSRLPIKMRYRMQWLRSQLGIN
ncbi:MAG: class I SAM-dependent methyltransferase [Bacteroidia bacterium]